MKSSSPGPSKFLLIPQSHLGLEDLTGRLSSLGSDLSLGERKFDQDVFDARCIDTSKRYIGSRTSGESD